MTDSLPDPFKSSNSGVMLHLQRLMPQASRSTLRRLLADGRVLADGKVVRSLKAPLSDHAVVSIAPARPSARQETLPEGLEIAYADAHVLVVVKPAGLLTATDEKEKRPTALALLQRHAADRNNKAAVYLVHRLDRAASGLLVFARDVRSLANLKMQFRRHTITREYDLLVHGAVEPPAGKLTHSLVERGDGRVVIARNSADGRKAVLDYQLLAKRGGDNGVVSHVRCRLYTGRKHQIRVQMLAIGHPVVGDDVYGQGNDKRHQQARASGTLAGRRGLLARRQPGAQPSLHQRLALHASRLVFKHPHTDCEMTFTSEPPFLPKPPGEHRLGQKKKPR
ncbi:MAG: RluA family pseudouridine synthase [Phycisphaerales bacterium]|nr:RluA family pseudouridine synthase [Phycisphaerales bacterium]